MNRKQLHRPALKRMTRVGLAATLVGCALALAGGGTAMAATPNTSHPATPHPGSTSVGSTQGFNLYNYSAETLDYVKVTGKLGAPPTAPIVAGQKVNFEIPSPFFSDDTGSVYYNVMDPSGTQVANLVINFSSGQVAGAGYWTYTVTNMSGQALTTMEIPDNPDGTSLHFEDASGSPQDSQSLPAGSAAEQDMIKSLCSTGEASCKFADVQQNEGWSDWKLVAQAYNGQSVEDQLNAGNSYLDQTTDTWGATVTAGGQLGPVNSSVQISYQHAVTTGTQYNISQTATEPPEDTTYIWAQVWQYQDSGSMLVTLGNTTWTLPGLTYYNADNKVSDPIGFQSTNTTGQVTLPGDSTLPNPASTPPLATS
jgi:hypothetical protein